MHASPPVRAYRIWAGWPGWPRKPTRVHTLDFAGVTVSEKLASTRKALAKEGCDALLLNDLAEIAWLFNMRGEDVECNPVFVAYAIVSADGATLFIDEQQVKRGVAAHLAEAKVSVDAYGKVWHWQMTGVV
jgi:Xaa-Pro aminopeptidase